MAKAPFKIKSPLEVDGHVGINGLSDAKYDLLVHGTNGIKIPSGTTDQRPQELDQGVIRYNTTLQQFEAYRASSWHTMTQVVPGSTAPVGGVKYDMFMQLDEDNERVVDVYMHDGSKWVSLIPSVRAEIQVIDEKINSMSFDYGEY